MSRDTEARIGITYILEKKEGLTAEDFLPAFFAVPEDNYSAAVTIYRGEGETGLFELNS